MKFQIILESTDVKKAQMPCDEFEKLVKRNVKLPGFRVASGQNLDGLKRESWDPREKLKTQILDLQARLDEAYRQMAKFQKPKRTICKVHGCELPIYEGELCKMHTRQNAAMKLLVKQRYEKDPLE